MDPTEAEQQGTQVPPQLVIENLMRMGAEKDMKIATLQAGFDMAMGELNELKAAMDDLAAQVAAPPQEASNGNGTEQEPKVGKAGRRSSPS